MEENLRLFDFVLDDGDMALIAGLQGVCGEAPQPDQIRF